MAAVTQLQLQMIRKGSPFGRCCCNYNLNRMEERERESSADCCTSESCIPVCMRVCASLLCFGSLSVDKRNTRNYFYDVHLGSYFVVNCVVV